MVIDSSALVAIILSEPEMEVFANVVAENDIVRLSAASYVEAYMVLTMRGRLPNEDALDESLSRYGIQIETLTPEQAKLATAAFTKHGKGRHPASLNYGDGFTYALAKATREPLLFKGNDFSKNRPAPRRQVPAVTTPSPSNAE